MKRTILTITIILISISTVANAQICRSRRALPWTMGGRQQAQIQRRYTAPRIVVRQMPCRYNRALPWTMGGNRYGGYYGHYNRTARKVAQVGRAIEEVADVIDVISVITDDRNRR